jgi:Zn-finger nucleic acid-binding protein
MCPKYCGVALKKVKVGGVEVDRCPECDGVWFDSRGEELLEVLRVGYGDAPDEMKKSWEVGGGRMALGKPKEYNCPQCGRQLRTYAYMAQPDTSFEIDGCPDGCGVWLDDGELDAAYVTLQALQPAALRKQAVKPAPGLFERVRTFLASR